MTHTPASLHWNFYDKAQVLYSRPSRTWYNEGEMNQKLKSTTFRRSSFKDNQLIRWWSKTISNSFQNAMFTWAKERPMMTAVGLYPQLKDKTSVWHHFEMDRSLKTSKGPFKNRPIGTVYWWFDRNSHTASAQETIGMTDTPADSGSHRISAWIFVFWLKQRMKWNSLELMDFFTP